MLRPRVSCRVSKRRSFHISPKSSGSRFATKPLRLRAEQAEGFRVAMPAVRGPWRSRPAYPLHRFFPWPTPLRAAIVSCVRPTDLKPRARDRQPLCTIANGETGDIEGSFHSDTDTEFRREEPILIFVRLQ